MYFLNVNSRMSLPEGRGTVCLFFVDLAMQTRNSIYLFIYILLGRGCRKNPGADPLPVSVELMVGCELRQ